MRNFHEDNSVAMELEQKMNEFCDILMDRLKLTYVVNPEFEKDPENNKPRVLSGDVDSVEAMEVWYNAIDVLIDHFAYDEPAAN